MLYFVRGETRFEDQARFIELGCCTNLVTMVRISSYISVTTIGDSLYSFSKTMQLHFSNIF